MTRLVPFLCEDLLQAFFEKMGHGVRFALRVDVHIRSVILDLHVEVRLQDRHLPDVGVRLFQVLRHSRVQGPAAENRKDQEAEKKSLGTHEGFLSRCGQQDYEIKRVIIPEMIHRERSGCSGVDG